MALPGGAGAAPAVSPPAAAPVSRPSVNDCEIHSPHLLELSQVATGRSGQCHQTGEICPPASTQHRIPPNSAFLGPQLPFVPNTHAFPRADSLDSVSRNAPLWHFCRFTRNRSALEGGRVPQPGDVLGPRMELAALGTREASKTAHRDDRGPGRVHSSLQGTARVGAFPASENSAFSFAAGRPRSRALAEEEGKGPE